MELVELSALLAELNLPAPTLNVLSGDEHLYSTSLLQIAGNIVATDTSVQCNNTDKVRNFLAASLTQNTDLVVTPEYSTPWAILREFIENNRLPNRHTIWTLGMQSITPQEFRTLVESINDITWIFDENALNSPGNFLSCLCYVFKVRNGNEDIPICTVQFKTEIMGGTAFERNNLICGSIVYRITGANQPTNLVSFLCADVRGITTEIRTELQQFSCLILHLQLNASPRDPQFSLYRQDIFSQANDEIEIIALNWAIETTLNGNLLGNETAWGSAFYTKSRQLNKSDDRINHLHRKGIYLCRWATYRTDVCFLHPNEQAIFLRLTKPSQRMGLGQTSVRSGIETTQTFKWLENAWNEQEVSHKDFDDHCENLEIDFEEHISVSPLNVVNIERLLNLSSGYIECSEWNNVEKMRSFQLPQNELVMRLTCLHDKSNDAVAFREQTLARFLALRTLIEDQNNIPDSLKELRNGCILKFYGPTRNFNLATTNGQQPAVGIYLGDMTNLQSAQKKFDMCFGHLGDSEKRRLVVWFRVAGNLEKIWYNKSPMVDDDFSEVTNSIARES